MVRQTYLAVVIIGLLLLIGCSNQAPKQAQEEKPVVAQTSQDPWEQLQEAARKEGKVVVTTSIGGEFPQFVRREWDKAGFGVELQITTMKGQEFGEKITTERKAGIYSMDVTVSGLITLANVVKPLGALDPIDESVLVREDVRNPGLWWNNELPYADKEKEIFISTLYPQVPLVVNSSLINPAEITSMRDLLKPEYKGKIVLNDPRVRGVGQMFFGAMLGSGELDEAYFKELKSQLGAISINDEQQMEWIAHGRYPIGVAYYPPALFPFKEAGATLEVLDMKDGVYLTTGSGGVGLFNNAPNPNAAKLFINWYLSKEIQAAVQPILMMQSSRDDVPTTGLTKDIVRQAGLNYFSVGNIEFLQQLPSFASKAEEIFK